MALLARSVCTREFDLSTRRNKGSVGKSAGVWEKPHIARRVQLENTAGYSNGMLSLDEFKKKWAVHLKNSFHIQNATEEETNEFYKLMYDYYVTNWKINNNIHGYNEFVEYIVSHNAEGNRARKGKKVEKVEVMDGFILSSPLPKPVCVFSVTTVEEKATTEDEGEERVGAKRKGADTWLTFIKEKSLNLSKEYYE